MSDLFIKSHLVFFGPKTVVAVITTLLQWIRISNQMNKYNAQDIDPEHWVHLNVRNMY